MKGGMRYRLRWFGDKNDLDDDQWINVHRLPVDTWAASTPAQTITQAYANEDIKTGMRFGGSNLWMPMNNAGVEVEIPYYSRNLWQVSFSNTEGTGFTLGGTIRPTYMADEVGTFGFHCMMHGDAGGNRAAGLIADAATAEDFTFMHFNGAPFRSFRKAVAPEP